MGRDYADEVGDKVARAGIGCFIGAVTLGTAYLFSGIANAIYAALKPESVEKQILRQKPSSAQGTMITGIKCSSCGETTEDGQLACHVCGFWLQQVAQEITVGGVSHLQVQWMTFVGLFLIGILFARASDQQVAVIGTLFILALLGWGLTLIRPTLNSLSRG